MNAYEKMADLVGKSWEIMNGVYNDRLEEFAAMVNSAHKVEQFEALIADLMPIMAESAKVKLRYPKGDEPAGDLLDRTVKLTNIAIALFNLTLGQNSKETTTLTGYREEMLALKPALVELDNLKKKLEEAGLLK